MKEFFTAQEAAVLFKQHADFEFPPTVPGQLLAKRGVEKRSGKSTPAQYPVAYWALLWSDMFERAVDRCRFEADLRPPKRTSAPSFPIGVTVARASKVPTRSRSVRYIEVKYAEKDEAKAAGARWDPEEKKWYIPANMDSKRFRWPQIAGAGSIVDP